MYFCKLFVECNVTNSVRELNGNVRANMIFWQMRSRVVLREHDMMGMVEIRVQGQVVAGSSYLR